MGDYFALGAEAHVNKLDLGWNAARFAFENREAGLDMYLGKC
jgi:hypothetical protein